MRSWKKVTATFKFQPQDWSIIHEEFVTSGSLGTIESSFPPSLSGYIFNTEESDTKLSKLLTKLKTLGAADIQVETVAESDWENSWKQFFASKKIGKSFWIVPSWEKPPPVSEGENLIILDPGQAFGTGDHATTVLSLSLLEEAVKIGDTVIDLGAGSGILSIAAKTLGAKSVYATEIEDSAYEACKRNFEINQCSVDLRLTGEVPADFPNADVVVSNLISAVIIRMAPKVTEVVKKNAFWIISGVIEENFADVDKAITSNNFFLLTKRLKSGWVGAVYKKQ